MGRAFRHAEGRSARLRTARPRPAAPVAGAIAAAIIAAAALAGSGSGSGAHEGASGVVRERMELMKSIAAATRTIGDMLKGAAAPDAAAAARAADAIAGHAFRMPELFPPGSDGPPSEALPAIWQDRARFDALAADLAEAAAGLAAAARDGAGLRPAFARVAGTCAACHRDFRLKN